LPRLVFSHFPRLIMLLVVLFAVALAVFMQLDADLPAVVLPYEAENSFAGKVVWITGASSGIGASLAEDMVRAGAKVVISARRVSQLEGVAEKCASLGEKPYVLPLDVTDYDAQQAAFDEVVQKFGRVDSLVLNAGMSQRNTAVNTELTVTEDLMNLNFMSFVSLTKIVLPSMLERKDGQLVIMSSLSGIIGTPLGSSYSATKFALHGYFNGLRAEVAQHGIGVTIVCPGPVVSEISAKAYRDPNHPRSSEEDSKMPTARCTFLVAKAMYYRMMEVWISPQPLLLMTYITKYMPFASNVLATKLLGPARVRVLENGGNLYDVSELLK